MKTPLIIAVALLAVVACAQAEQKLAVQLEATGGTWNLYGFTAGTYYGYTNDGAANAGLASYNIKMSGIESGFKMAPNDYKATLPDRGTWGFSFGVDEMIITAGASEAFGGQDTAALNRCIYNVGNTAGAFPFNSSNTWSVPVLLATGTYGAGQTPAIRDVVNGVATTSIAAVFSAQGVVPPVQATVYVIPEPATLALLGMGALALIRRRR